MLKELRISHLILIEQAAISFEKGFTVLSGETGAGKSAIIEALRLILGARTDLSLLRHGAEKGSVSALFDLETLPHAQRFLQEKGIEAEDSTQLIISREILANGKTRAFVNHQPVQLSLLKELSKFLLLIVGQHDNHELFHVDEHRRKLDLFADYDLKTYQEGWQALQTIQEELEELKTALSTSFREREICLQEIKEIEEAQVKAGEEESLFETYSLLASGSERHAFIQELMHTLSGVLSALNRSKAACSALTAKDPKCAEELSLYPQLLIETKELLHSLNRYESELELDPSKLESINQRLSLLTRLKRKYGDLVPYLASQKERLKKLQNLEGEVEWKNHLFETQLAEVKKWAAQLSEDRKRTASVFAKKMTECLHALNMQQANFYIELSSIPLQSTGQDKVEFFLDTNVGEKRVALKDSASGGELARVLLSLYALLAGKENVGTLVFDEIDANIGGTTASLIGEKLQLLGNSLQILSVTHFPQVAKCADHHLQISKSTNKGRTLTEIHYLENRERELARMSGFG